MKLKALFTVFLFSLSSLGFSSVYVSSATASYYAEKYHGRKTASGEVFNMYDMTCAHKTLPFGTVLRVTNLKNNRSVDVRVNDRGPFVKGREIDVSKAAAQKLDMIKTGTANVRIEIVSRPDTKNDSTPLASAKKAAPSKGVFWDVQIGSFSNKENANNVAQGLIRDGFENVYFQKTKTVTRVVLKKVPDSSLKSVESRLRKGGYSGYMVKIST